mmetsp:Transcript_15474/g.31802  ORF Transcript_15474/g.31802 Transcript_15474/m.31802 type:complete len:99 (-) Transcript_15474:158-454(-)|eukprot:CAMPEP_0171593942 /NCGR_PEP_ID=MMETSP0990-20121206/406_1 /TAXON_ID=483369 /ORGANISM="non described non described, Strain CCMP2098" /LENGTH=98 /DNA_ID=CAMNT_0012154561 /DNA_START=169 /DNA_END=465 /DNA_ORIENTATION=-
MAAKSSKGSLKVSTSPTAEDDLVDIADIQSPKMTLKGVDLEARLADGGEIKKVQGADFRNDDTQYLSTGSIKAVKDADRQKGHIIGGGGIKGIKGPSP